MIKVDATRETVTIKGETETLLGEFGNAMYYFLDTIASTNKTYAKWAYRDLVVVLVKAAVLIEKKHDIKLEVGPLDEEGEEEDDSELLEAMTEALSKTPPDKLRSIIKSMFEDDENRKEKK